MLNGGKESRKSNSLKRSLLPDGVADSSGEGVFESIITITAAEVDNAQDRTKLTDPASPEVLALADRVIRAVGHQVTPWHGMQAWVAFLISIIAAFGTGVSAPHFAERFLKNPLFENLPANLKKGLEIGVAGSSALPNVLLSLKANLTVHIHWISSFWDTKPKDFTRNIVPLTLTTASTPVSAKIGLVAIEDVQLLISAVTYIILQYFVAIARIVSAMGTNGFFAVKMLKDLRGNKDTPEMTVLQDALKKLSNLVKDKNYDGFIDQMSDSGLYQHLMKVKFKTTGNSIDHMNDIFNSLHNVLAEEKFEGESKAASHPYKQKILNGSCYVLALLASVGYFSTALTVVPYQASGTSGIPDPSEMPEEFLKFLFDVALGFSSAGVNTAIAATALIKFFNEFTCKLPTAGECCVLPFRMILLVCYALVQGGMTRQYPLTESIAWPQAILSTLVSFTIAGLSFDGFINMTSIGWSVHRHKVLDALIAATNEGSSLKDHYDSLNPDRVPGSPPNEQQKRLIQVLNDYLQWAAKPLSDFINHTKKEVITEIFTEEVYTKLNNYQKMKNHEPVSSPTVVIITPASESTETKTTTPIPIPGPVLSARQRRALDPKDDEFVDRGLISVPGDFSKPTSVQTSSPLLGSVGEAAGSLVRRFTTQRRPTTAEVSDGEAIVLPETSSSRRSRSPT